MMKRHYIFMVLVLVVTVRASAQDCDTLHLPYSADFSQCWRATGGATFIDSDHASITSAGQKITSPWLESERGKTFVYWYMQRDGNPDYNSEQYILTIESENGVIERWSEYVRNTVVSNSFISPGGRIRLSFEYIGSNPVPSFLISSVKLFQYDIDVLLEAPGIAHIGDTMTFTAHATLQENDTPDYYHWPIYKYDQIGNIISVNYNDTTIISHNDSTLVIVWNTAGRYQIQSSVGKYDVYQGYVAGVYSAHSNILIVDHVFHEEDSIYYTSTDKDTVIGCHPQLCTASLPECVKAIADFSFIRLTNLSSVTLPNGLESIGKGAFLFNTGLSEITFPRGLKYVGDDAFGGNTNLEVINFNADSCLVMAPSANRENYWRVFSGCENVTTINIGENVKRIPNYAFECYSKLRGTLVIPDSVTYIGTGAFYHWDANWEANNDTLQVILGSGVTEIGDYAFGCPRAQLSSVVSRAIAPPTIYEQTFYRYGPEYTPVLYVPCGSTQAYRAAQHWNRINDIREDCDGVEDVEESSVVVYAIDNGIVVYGAMGEYVSVYDMNGRLLSTRRNEGVLGSTSLRFEVPVSGTYFIKVGNHPARKVVVIR